MTNFITILSILLLSLPISCGEETSFSASAVKKSITGEPKSDETVPEEVASSATVGEEEVPPEITTETPAGELVIEEVIATVEDVTEPVTGQPAAALTECAKKWEATPFTDAELMLPTVVTIKEGIQNGELVFSDNAKTEKPRLMLINYNVKNANNGQFNLLNSNSWYCLNILAKVINNFTIESHCDSKVAIVTKSAQQENGFTISKQECPAP